MVFDGVPIVEIIAYHARVPLRKTVRHASYTRSENDTLIVRCRLDDGTEGWGEGLPRRYVTGETIETAFALLQAWFGDRQASVPVADGHRRTSLDGLRSRLGSGLADAVAMCRQLRPPVASERPDSFGNSVRCAVELSILDAAARREGVPLAAVTGLVPETTGIRESARRVRYSGALTFSGTLRERIDAWKLRLYGFSQCKVKVGVEGADDAARLGRIRRILGGDVDLRIDVNEAWTCDSLEAKLAPLLPFRISSVEQPVARDAADCLARVRPQIPVPVMLDESLCSLSDAERAIERGTCDLFNIRLSKCGGFINSLLIAAMAHRAGLGYQLGCQVGETGILSAAGRHFATSVAGIRYLEGSYDRHLVRERLTVEDVTFGYRGFAPALDRPGLGVSVDEKALERITVREEGWQIA